MKWHILLSLLFLAVLIISHADAATPSLFPYAIITSHHGTAVNLYAEPNQRSIIYSNATLHIFAEPNTTYDIYVNERLYLTNVTSSEHTIIPLHLARNTTQIRVFIHPSTELVFTVLITNTPITENDLKNNIERMLHIPPWEWTEHEWAVFGDTIFGAFLAIPFSIVFARYMILRKWGGASVIS